MSKGLTRVPIRHLDTGPADSVRGGPRDPDIVRRYADRILAELPFDTAPKVYSYRKGRAWRYLLADGGYRLAALKLALPDSVHIEAEVVECVGRDDADRQAQAERKAWAAACRANAGHGQSRSREDLRAALRAALARPEVQAMRSFAVIGAYCDCDEKTAKKHMVEAGMAHPLLASTSRPQTIRNSGSSEARESDPSAATPPANTVPTTGSAESLPPDPPHTPDGEPAPEAEPPPLTDRPELWDGGEGAADGNADIPLDDATLPPAGYVHAVDLPPLPDAIHVEVPLGVLAVKDRDKFDAAIELLRQAERAVRECVEAPAGGQHLRSLIAGRDMVQGNGRIPEFARWAVALADCRPDDEPCFLCDGDPPAGHCRACGSTGYGSVRSRALASDTDRAQRLPFREDTWEEKA